MKFEIIKKRLFFINQVKSTIQKASLYKIKKNREKKSEEIFASKRWTKI